MVTEKAASLSPIERPVIMKNGEGNIVAGLKVDDAVVRGGAIELKGWSTPQSEIRLFSDGVELECRLLRKMRPDVSKRLGMLEVSPGFGFIINARFISSPTANVELRYLVKLASGEQVFSYTIPLRQVGVGSATDDGLFGACGEISAAFGSTLLSRIVVQGWFASGDGVTIALETDSGQRWLLQDAYRYTDPSLSGSLRAMWGSRAEQPCFLIQFEDVLSWRSIRLIAVLPEGSVNVLSEADFSSLPIDPQAAAICLFDLKSPLVEFTERVEQVDVPVLSALISHSRSNWPNLSVTRHVMGERRVDAAKPLVSVVVPLFGRLDFVESQLLAFSEDPWLVEHAQLIYVLDDPSLKDSFQLLAEQLRRIYPIPFEWVYGGINRGYSGANNLGASFAKGEFVVFLNSDVFPIMPGWLKVMVNTLAENVGLGAVGPRLLFPDGSLQHAGMEFLYRSEWGVWINHHPFMGCPKELDPNQDLCTVPAVTGACLAMRKSTFDSVGGWDTGYLLGDFEDSDLCFKVRALGLDIGYLPTVELTHLERQSFKLVGGDVFRQKVVLYNAARHQKRWLNEISSVRIPEAGV